MTRRSCVFALLSAVSLALALAGCNHQGPAQAVAEGGSAPAAPRPPVKVTAYINVSSGCQQATVDLLQQLEQKYAGRVQVEFVDFGKSPGIERWRADGFSCLTILINGQQTVTFGPPGERRRVTFSFPAGLQWEHEDLEQAIAAAVDGTMAAGAEAGAQSRETEPVKAAVTTSSAQGKAQVRVDGRVVFEFAKPFDELSPADRAKKSADRLRNVFAQGLSPSAIQVVSQEGACSVQALGAQLAVAGEPDAQAANVSAQELAEKWATNLKKSLVAASRKAPSGGPQASPKYKQ